MRSLFVTFAVIVLTGCITMPPCYYEGTCGVGQRMVVLPQGQARTSVPGGYVNPPVAVHQRVIGGGYYAPAYYGGYPGFGPLGNAVMGGFGLGLGYGFVDSFYGGHHGHHGGHHGGHHDGGNNDRNSHNVDSHDTTNNYYGGDGGDAGGDFGDAGGDFGGDGGDAGGGDSGGDGGDDGGGE